MGNSFVKEKKGKKHKIHSMNCKLLRSYNKMIIIIKHSVFPHITCVSLLSHDISWHGFGSQQARCTRVNYSSRRLSC